MWVKKSSGGEGSLEDLISKNATAISDLKDAIEDELDVIKGDIKDIQADIKKINGQITAINQNLAGLHTLVVSRLTSISLAPICSLTVLKLLDSLPCNILRWARVKMQVSRYFL